MTTIVCLSHGPLVARSVWNKYKEEIEASGCLFESWNMQGVFGIAPDIKKEKDIPCERSIPSLHAFEDELEKTDLCHTVFFVGIPETWRNRHVFSLLAKKDCIFCKYDFCANTIPIKKQYRDIVRFLGNPMKMWLFMQRKINKLYWRANGIRYAAFFSSSSSATGRIPINHPDFEKYLFCKGITKENLGLDPKMRYAVFYDSYYPLHPDFKTIHRISIDVDYDRYLSSLNSFFEWFERKYGVQLIIAAHPRSNYNSLVFNGRPIIKNKTCELTVCSEYVINHSSNSTSFAMLAGKPIVFITNNQMEKCSYMSRYISELSSYLGKEKFNIDEQDLNDMEVSVVDECKRKKYIESFIISTDSCKKRNGHIFSEYAINKTLD
ncbi:MAG: hypothetical protein MJY94_01290 [Bacteroidales bacterium]|nr:hypothetical protein [Bacteroidales bacterium]